MSRLSLPSLRRPKHLSKQLINPLIMLLLIASGLVACGQKGPLYLPEAEQTPNTQQDVKPDSKQTTNQDTEKSSSKPVKPAKKSAKKSAEK